MIENKEKKSIFRESVEWAAELSMAEHAGSCGICAWRSAFKYPSKDEQKEALERHVRRRHKESVVELHETGQLELSNISAPSAPVGGSNDSDLLAVAGIAQVEQLDRTDLLSIPSAIRKKAEVNGETFYWKRKEEVEQLKSQGARLVYTDGHNGANQHSSENGILTCRELVCMALPHELTTERKRQKAARLNDQLNSRAEEIRVSRDDYEKRTYDYLRSDRNLDHQQAERISKSLSNRRRRDESAGSNLGMSITDNAGRSEY